MVGIHERQVPDAVMRRTRGPGRVGSRGGALMIGDAPWFRVASLVCILAPVLIGCGGYDLQSATLEEIDAPSRGRIVVFPLSCTPEVVAFPGMSMDRLYAARTGGAVPSKEQISRDMDRLWRASAGVYVSRTLAAELGRLAGDQVEVVFPLADDALADEYCRCVSGWKWLAPDEDSAPGVWKTSVRELRGLTPKEIAEKYDADYLVWGDISVIQSRVVSRFVLYDRHGTVVWVGCLSTRPGYIGTIRRWHKRTVVRAAVAFGIGRSGVIDTSPDGISWTFDVYQIGHGPPGWLTDVVGRLGAVLHLPGAKETTAENPGTSYR